MIWELKAGVTLEGVHPALTAPPVAWIIWAVTRRVLGRDPIVTGARVDRELPDGSDDPSTRHDDGEALDLRANDADLATRQRYAGELRRYLEPMGFKVLGPYPLPEGHVHVRIYPAKFAGFVLVAASLVLAVVNAKRERV